MRVLHIPFNQFEGTGCSTINYCSLCWLVCSHVTRRSYWFTKLFGKFTCYAVEGKTFVSDNQPGRRDIGCKQVIRNFTKHVSRGLFLKSPCNLWALNQIFKLKYKEWKRESLLKSQSILFCNWYVYHIICKTIETSTLNVYKTTFPSRELSGLSRNGSHMKGMWKFKRTSQR